jgi:hypothetical protein
MLCRLVAEYEQFWRNMQCLCSGPKFLAATWLHSDTTLKTTIWSHMHTNLKICIFADFQQFFLPLRPYASMDGQQMNSQSVSSDTTISTPDVPSFFHPDVQNHLMTTCFTCKQQSDLLHTKYSSDNKVNHLLRMKAHWLGELFLFQTHL